MVFIIFRFLGLGFALFWAFSIFISNSPKMFTICSTNCIDSSSQLNYLSFRKNTFKIFKFYGNYKN